MIFKNSFMSLNCYEPLLINNIFVKRSVGHLKYVVLYLKDNGNCHVSLLLYNI